MFTIMEVIYILLTILAVGYIFSGIVNPSLIFKKRFSLNDLKFGIMVGAPAVILHELAHKFAGLALGIQSHYEVWTTGLLIGIILKAVGSGFILLAPGYVVMEGMATGAQMIITAAVGPLVNLALWLGTAHLVKKRNHSRKKLLFLITTREINKWLFIFNMIPIPPLDGSKVLWPLISMLF